MKCCSCKGDGKDQVIQALYGKERNDRCMYCGGSGEQEFKLWFYWTRTRIGRKFITLPFLKLKKYLTNK